MGSLNAKIILINILFLTVFTCNLNADPIVNSVAGIVTNYQNITISGSGFGTKNNPAPIKWDNFENGSVGSFVENGWFTTATQSDKKPKYSNFVRPNSKGSVSAFHDFTGGNYNSTLGLCGQQVGKIYISGWYYNETDGAPSRNVKTFAFRGGVTGEWELPNLRFDQYPSTTSGHVYLADNTNRTLMNNWNVGGDLNSGAWHRIEFWFDQGTLNQNNGRYVVWRDLSTWTDNAGTFTTSTLPYGAFHNIYLIHYFATDTGTPMPEMRWYWDEVYIDNTLARVEIGNNKNWDQCTQREIQIPTAWSNTSISFTVNQGTFQEGATAYVFVVDASGTPSQTGLQISFGNIRNPVDVVSAPNNLHILTSDQ